MKTCVKCGLPDPGTGERFLMVGMTPGKAWQTTEAPSIRIGEDGETEIVGGGDAVLVDADVPVVSATCRCRGQW